jgi:hypothetical protein
MSKNSVLALCTCSGQALLTVNSNNTANKQALRIELYSDMLYALGWRQVIGILVFLIVDPFL